MSVTLSLPDLISPSCRPVFAGLIGPVYGFDQYFARNSFFGL